MNEGETVFGNVLLNDGDPDGDALTAILESRPSSGNITRFDNDGDFWFDTDGDFDHLHSGETGDVTFTYTADDGTDGTASGTVNITVQGVNDSPSAQNVSISTDEDETVSISLSDDVADSDHADNQLAAHVPDYGEPSHGVVHDQGDDLVLKYDPDKNFNGSDQFTYKVSDGDKAATAEISITVNAKNDPPTASAVDTTTVEEKAVTIDVSGYIGDPDDGLSQLSATADGSPSHGRISDSDADDLQFTYEPESDYNGLDSFRYQVTDGEEATSARVELSVVSVPDVVLKGGAAIGFEPRDGLNTGLVGTPIGVMKFSADSKGSFSGITLTNDSPGIDGIKQIRVYPSDSEEIDTNASPIVEKDVDTEAAPSKITLDLKGETIRKVPRYLFVTAKVKDGTRDKLTLTIDSPSDVSFKSRGTVETSASAPFPIKLWKGEAQLPVELASFEARGTENGISLRWRTASEQNNAGFQVQRRVVESGHPGPTATDSRESTDAGSSSWKTVGRLDGAGTTDEPQDYRFTDTDLPYAADSVRYRLKQIDTDGSAHLTDPVTVARNAVGRVQMKDTYPNPASGPVTVRYAVPSSTEGEAQLRLYDVLGRTVRTVSAEAVDGRVERQLDVSRLSSGVYILRLQVGGTARTRRLTIVR